VVITAPASGVEVRHGDVIGFSAIASDPTEGDLSAGLSWGSDVDGDFGSGASFSYAGLTLGTHLITARVIDASGAPPVVTIGSPPVGSLFSETETLLFSASANDPETGDVSSTLLWVSQKDGTLGTGPSFSLSGLSRGKHNITVTATDPGGKPGSATSSFHIRK
jgi:hypothetical protein